VKFFAMIMMVAGHTFFEMANPETYNINLFPWDWWGFLRGKTAPTFLFLSGAVHVFANFKSGAAEISKEAFHRRIVMSLVLLVIGYTMNSPINSFSELFSVSDSKLHLFFQVNILHIFGIGLFILALIYKFGKSPQNVLYISLAFGIATIVLAPIAVSSELDYLPVFIRNYFNYKAGSIFTLLPYIAYIFMGTVFGILLRNFKISQNNIPPKQNGLNKYSLNILMLFSSIILIVSGIIITKLCIAGGMGIEMRSDTGAVTRNLGIITALIFLARQIKINSLKFQSLITTLSRRAIYIYIVHLSFIYGIGNIHGLKFYLHNQFSPPSAFLISFGVIISSILITLLIDKSLKYKISKMIYLLIFIIYSIVFFVQ